MYDTHSHLNFRAFADDYQTVIKNSLKQGMFLNIVGSELLTSKRAKEIANEFKNDPVYAAVGLHPSHLDSDDKIHAWDYKQYKKLALDPKVVAIGETGLDLFHSAETFKKQKKVFKEHIRLALEVKKPLILHCRPSKDNFDAYHDLIKTIINYQLPITNYAVVHCFLSNWQIAKQLLDLNLYISFTGIITYKNVDDYLIDAIKKIPLDRIMIETDCPYLTPEPYRGQKRNEPLYVKYVARKIAEIKGIDVKTVIDATTENGKNFFDIKK
ncbi:MAG: TatD family hydrolase [Candidatus Jacksonbacteria bacterium]